MGEHEQSEPDDEYHFSVPEDRDIEILAAHEVESSDLEEAADLEEGNSHADADDVIGFPAESAARDAGRARRFQRQRGGRFRRRR